MQQVVKLAISVFSFLSMCESKRQPEYGIDFILFPSQDGSGNVVPAFLTKNFTNRGHMTTLPTKNDIHFYLYTASNLNSPVELFVDDFDGLESSPFRKNQDLKILCHGFAGSYINPYPQDIKNKYLQSYGRRPLNVITLDWGLLAVAPFYIEAVDHVPWVGEAIGKMIQFLVDVDYITLDKIHFIGHSLGAHAGAVAGRYIYTNLGMKLPRITGLDPASPLVENKSLSINSRVAKFVDIIHTDGAFLGISSPLGVVDFYPNGGLEQAGCHLDLFGVCSHVRSHQYYLESIVPYGTSYSKFASCRCHNCAIRDALCYHEKFLFDKCRCHPQAFMGEGAEGSLPGLYYLSTNIKAPFSLS